MPSRASGRLRGPARWLDGPQQCTPAPLRPPPPVRLWAQVSTHMRRSRGRTKRAARLPPCSSAGDRRRRASGRGRGRRGPSRKATRALPRRHGEGGCGRSPRRAARRSARSPTATARACAHRRTAPAKRPCARGAFGPGRHPWVRGSTRVSPFRGTAPGPATPPRRPARRRAST